MKKKLLTIFFLYISIFSYSYSSEKIVNNLKEGGKIVFIRHAIAPGGGDPPQFTLKDCNTQRNLSQDGIDQSKKIGLFFLKNNILIEKVLSSEWCRCKDTAKHAFKNFKTFNALNSFFSEKFKKNKKKQMEDLLRFIRKWDGERNLVLITHYVVILETINKTASSGELIILDKNLNFIGRVSDH